MPNKQYISGRAKEYKVKKQYEMKGYTVLRTAGSHGFADLIAVETKKKEIIFIQCKGKKFKESEVRRLHKEHKDKNGIYSCSFEVI